MIRDVEEQRGLLSRDMEVCVEPAVYELPQYKKYPMDAVCLRILNGLEAKNWSVPGIKVIFNKGEGANVRRVYMVKGPDFRLKFAREPLAGGGPSGVDTIDIPERKLKIYEDESGPLLLVYAGKDWKRDRKKFMNHCLETTFRNSSICKSYSGVGKDGHCPKKWQRAPYLLRVQNPDDRADQVVEYFKTKTVFKVFVAFLKQVAKNLEA